MAPRAKEVDASTSAKDRWAPLHLASLYGHIEVVKALLKKGADLSVTNDDGVTPLHLASQNGHFEVVEALLAKKADVLAADKDGWTPLHYASREGHAEIVNVLLEKEHEAGFGDAEMSILSVTQDQDVGASQPPGPSHGDSAGPMTADTDGLERVLEGHALALTSVAFSGDGRWLVSASMDHTAKIWDVTTGGLIHTLDGHRGPVLSVTFSTHGRRVVTGSADGTVAVWDATTGRRLKTFLGHTSVVMSVAWSQNGRWIASGGKDHTVKLWDISQDYRCAGTILALDQVTSVAFGPWSDWVAFASASGQIRVWNIDLGRVTIVITTLPDLYVISIAVSPVNSNIVASSYGPYGPVVEVWDRFSGALLGNLEGHEKAVTSIQFSADGGQIISSSDEIRIWETTTGACLLVGSYPGEKDCIKSVSLSTDNSMIAVGGGHVWMTA